MYLSSKASYDWSIHAIWLQRVLKWVDWPNPKIWKVLFSQYSPFGRYDLRSERGGSKDTLILGHFHRDAPVCEGLLWLIYLWDLDPQGLKMKYIYGKYQIFDIFHNEIYSSRDLWGSQQYLNTFLLFPPPTNIYLKSDGHKISKFHRQSKRKQ